MHPNEQLSRRRGELWGRGPSYCPGHRQRRPLINKCDLKLFLPPRVKDFTFSFAFESLKLVLPRASQIAAGSKYMYCVHSVSPFREIFLWKNEQQQVKNSTHKVTFQENVVMANLRKTDHKNVRPV